MNRVSKLDCASANPQIRLRHAWSAIELLRGQMAFNLRRWSELVEEENLAAFEGQVETDRHGHILMSPPASSDHGRFQSELSHLLKVLLPKGKTYGECPISTPDGVRVADAALDFKKRLAKWARRFVLDA